MAQKPETVFRKKVRGDLQELTRLGPFWFEAIQQKAIVGTPDFLCCIKGLFLALELKATDTSTVSFIQMVKLEAITKADGIALIVSPNCWGELRRWMKEFLTEDKK